MSASIEAAKTTSTATTSAGGALAAALAHAGLNRAFIVPGESYLPLLEGMREHAIEPVVCRNEGGAAYMALGDAMVTGRPGVVMVTRAPGASNAMVGVSAAYQEGAPLILFVGLVTLDERDRDSFQEFDLRAWYGTTAKRVFVLDSADRAHTVVEEAIRIATTGRPGPVVIGLPEDVLSHEVPSRPAMAAPALVNRAHPDDVAAAAAVLEGAERPVILVGGHPWSGAASSQLASFAERHSIPVLGGWHVGDRLAVDSAVNAGWVGYGAHPEAWALLAAADALLVIGTTLGDVITRGWTQPAPERTAVINPDPELRGHISPPLVHVVAEVEAAVAALAELSIAVGAGWEARAGEAHAAYLRSIEVPVPVPVPGSGSGPGLTERGARDRVRAAEVVARLNERLSGDSVTLAYGAGRHCAWPQRYLRKAEYPSELGLQNGSMGFSVPAAIAASLRQPERIVVCVAGDGELLMNGQELATAIQHGARMLLLVIDDSCYGTIRDHQQRMFPGARFAVDLQNPDFAAMVTSFGGTGFRVERSGDADGAVDGAIAAVRAGGVAALHVLIEETDVA
ncbi:thiamine pyrophosphate-dependent enzyme [Leucobacter sp. USHLN153]|uniref:thiamine pyrophosphate-dependent enzyme n=1 Tax=Leucobacter sp. USHLN153 TaxID=3081268 RepID=UPI003018243E